MYGVNSGYLRCARCDEHWPNGKTYAECPLCDGETFHVEGVPGMTWNEAKERVEKEKLRRKRQADFEEYYAERETARLRKELEPL